MARKLAKNVYVGETFYAAGSTPAKEIADQITNPAAWDDDDTADADSDDKDNGPDYDSQKVGDLADLAAERGLEVKGSGKDGKVVKADLVAALLADDASASE